MRTLLLLVLSCLAACGRSPIDAAEPSSVTSIPVPTSAIAESDPIALLHASFYAGTELAGAPILEHDTNAIDYDWGDYSPGCGVPNDGFSARWVGDVELAAGVYLFETLSDDGVRVRVDGETVIDFWGDHPATTLANRVEVGAGVHHIEVEYYENGGQAVVRVSWALDEQFTPAPSGDPDLTAAQAFVSDLTLGVNVERGWAWEVGAEYYAYLRDSVHATHVRLFYPWRPWVDMGGGSPGNAAPDAARFGRILDAVQHAVDAGLKVYLDCSDVIDDGEAAFVYDHVRNCARWIAERGFDPRRVAVGPINEHAGSDNPTWNPIRRDLHAIMRAELPGFVLVTGASGWKGRPDLLRGDFEVFDDLRVVYEWHHYDSVDATTWTARAAELATWRSAHGNRPTVCGECGPGYWDESVEGTTLQYAWWVWPRRFAEQLPALASEHPSLWAVTYGNAYRLNRSGDDPTLIDELLASFRANEAAIRERAR